MNLQTLILIIFLPAPLDFKLDIVTLILLKLLYLCRQSEFAELALEAWVCEFFELAILLHIRWASHCHTRPWQSNILHAETPLHHSFAYRKLQLIGMQLLSNESWWIMRCCQCASLLAKWWRGSLSDAVQLASTTSISITFHHAAVVKYLHHSDLSVDS